MLLASNAAGARRAAPKQSADAAAVRRRMARLLAERAAAVPGSVERRRVLRRVFRRPLVLVALDAAGQPLGEPFSVHGKDLSPQGLGFVHRLPLMHRYVAAALQLTPGEPLYLLLQLRWQRFLRPGAYESGGRIVAEICQTEAQRLGLTTRSPATVNASQVGTIPQGNERSYQ